MSREIRIYPDARFVRWVANFKELGRETIGPHAAPAWRLEVEVMFGATQQLIHVDSGDLLGSGNLSIEDESGDSVTAAITYGGGQRSMAKPHWKHQTIDYAKYELERGGSHDFFERAHNKTKKRLQKGAGETLLKIIGEKEW